MVSSLQFVRLQWDRLVYRTIAAHVYLEYHLARAITVERAQIKDMGIAGSKRDVGVDKFRLSRIAGLDDSQVVVAFTPLRVVDGHCIGSIIYIFNWLPLMHKKRENLLFF